MNGIEMRRRCMCGWLAVMFAGLLLLGGCAVDESKEVGLYRSVLDGTKAEPVEYRAGEPVSLQTALLLANQNNERIAVSGEDYVQALIDKDRAAAAFFPTISLVPSFSKADSTSDRSAGFVSGTTGGTGTGGTTGGTTGTDTGTGTTASGSVQNFAPGASGSGLTDVPANLHANLFNGFRDYANVQRAKSDINRFRALMLDLRSTVLLDTARAYYQVLRSERSVAVLEMSGQTQDALVRDMQAKDRAGTAKKLDVRQVEAQAAATRVSLITARTDVRNGRALLTFLAGAPVLEAPLLDQMDVPREIESLDDLLVDAFTGRQDLAAARANIESARQNFQSAVGEYYPTISLNVNYYLSRQSFPTDSEWNALLSANLPIFTGGLIHANVRTALSRLRQAKLQESLVRRQVEQDVRIGFENLAGSERGLAELRIEVEAAREALRVARGLSQVGSGIILDVLVAQDRLLSAELQLASAEFDRKLFYLSLLRVIGRLNRPAPGMLLTTAPATAPSSIEIDPGMPATVPSTRPASRSMIGPATRQTQAAMER